MYHILRIVWYTVLFMLLNLGVVSVPETGKSSTINISELRVLDHTRQMTAEASALQHFELSIFQDHRGETMFFRLLCHTVNSICICIQFPNLQLSLYRETIFLRCQVFHAQVAFV